ncbi:MAG: hypothetical protein Q9208_003303 [Pyrenodesmia sp. 3 TL-2023]
MVPSVTSPEPGIVMVNGDVAFVYTFSHPQGMEAHRHLLKTLQSIIFYRHLPKAYPELDVLIFLLLNRLERSKDGGGIDGTDDSARIQWKTEVYKLVGKVDGSLEQLVGLGIASFEHVGLGMFWLLGEP